MAKAVKLYAGNASNGVAVEVAMRKDGKYFARWVVRTSYGVGWSRWSEHKASFVTGGYSKIEQLSHVWNQYKKPRLEWGFNTLIEVDVDGPIRYRLPNN